MYCIYYMFNHIELDCQVGVTGARFEGQTRPRSSRFLQVGAVFWSVLINNISVYI